MPSYVVSIADPRAKTFVFVAMRTGGKSIAKGDAIFVFASEHDGGAGLIARGIVTAVQRHAKPRGVARWTPRVSITVTRTGEARLRPRTTEALARRGCPASRTRFQVHPPSHQQDRRD